MYYYADRNNYDDDQLNVEEKLHEIGKSEMPLAWDGCHKIYFCQSGKDVKEAKDLGYEMHLPSEIHDIWNKSCFLKFAHPWDASVHPLEIHQGEEWKEKHNDDYDDDDDYDYDDDYDDDDDDDDW
jgi:hypothetical protein